MNENANNDSVDSVSDALRMDLSRSFQQSVLDPRMLSPFQRILLTTDGTVTDILEAQFWEAIGIVKLYQEMERTSNYIQTLETSPGEQVLIRKVLLKGKSSHRNYIYAESMTVLENLSPELREGLLHTGKPIGQLMIENRVESFREILSVNKESAAGLCGHFGIRADDQVISRTYRILCSGKPIMLITEVFPETSFRE